MTNKTAIEYGIFNLLPEGRTLNDIPEYKRWLYEGPFQTDCSKDVIEYRVEQINKERQKYFDNGEKFYDIDTYCEMRERIITYGPWIQSGKGNEHEGHRYS